MIAIHSYDRTKSDLPITIIKPPKGWFQFNWREFWQYRELLFFLTWRDVKVKYKQALLGIAWAILVPVLHMVIFTIIFKKVANLPTNGLDGFVFYLTGLVPWTYFATAVSMGSISMVTQANLLTKIYLPRLFIPTASCIASLVDFFMAFSVLLIMMMTKGIIPSITTLFLPLIMLIAFATALGVSFFLSALNVKYRDIKFVVPFLVQIWMYCTVLLPFSAIPERYGKWRYIYGINPMACVIEGTRWCLAHHKMFLDTAHRIPVPPPIGLYIVGVPVAAGMLFFGLSYFKRLERMFADIV